MEDWKDFARESLVGYSIAMQPEYDPGKHHYVLADALEKVYSGEITRLMVFMPPQHGKSQEASGHFPAWAFGKSRGKKKIAFATYSQTYANEWGKRVHGALSENVYRALFPDVKINPKGSDGMSIFDLVGGGWYMATSVGGALTGRGPDVIIIDDPVKNYEEAASEVIQVAHQNWFDTVVRTRLPKAIILIMTRWHENDLAGYLLRKAKEQGEEWTVISFPALCETESDVLGRAVGEALWPEKIDRVNLLKIKGSVPPQHWTSMFQQRPTAAEGGIFKRDLWKRYTIPPREMVKNMDEVIQSWDLKFKSAATKSKVAGLVIGRKDANFYLFDVFNEHVGFPATIHAINDWNTKWPEAAAKYIEAKANGPAVVETAQDKIPGLILVEKNISKEDAWHGVSPYQASGNCYLPEAEHCPLVGDFIEQLAGLPNSTFNDMADAWAQGIFKLKLDIGSTAIIEYMRQLAARRAS